MPQEITLANLAEKSARQVFEYVKKHMLTQNDKAIEHHQCKYKTNEGLRCAGGCLIAPEEYRLMFEGNNWASLINKFNITGAHNTLIYQLQLIHDTAPVSTWPTRLNDFAVEFAYLFK